MRNLGFKLEKPCRKCGERLVNKFHRHWKAGDSFTKGDDLFTDQEDIPCKGDTCEIQPIKPWSFPNG